MIRHSLSASIHRGRSVTAKRDNPNNVSTLPQPYKTILRSFFAPVLSLDNKPPLLNSDAIGTVATAQANFMRVVVDQVPDGCSSNMGVELLCVVKALLKKIERRVVVGDKVLVGSIDWVDRRGMIKNVFHRQSEIRVPPVANVDHLLVLFSLDRPKLEPFALTRFLVEAESTGIPLTLALNKSDLVTQEELESWKIRLRGWNYEPLFCSVANKVGLDAIGHSLPNRTSVIIGPSGVGKSSLINGIRSNFTRAIQDGQSLFEHKLGQKWFEDQRVGQVSTSNGRGRHTTTNVSLLPLSQGGYIADTPGFNNHKHRFLKVQKQTLASCFPEIRKMLEEAECRFQDCSHTEEAGCAVKCDWERYSYYVQLRDEIKIWEESQLKKHGTKKEGGARYKMRMMGGKKAGPWLDPKKYRRESRKKMKQTMFRELDI